MPLSRREFCGLGSAVVVNSLLSSGFGADKVSKSNDLVMVVMDPLAAPLSCPCVEGYAQRDYTKLAEFLQKQLNRPITIAFSESLTVALKEKTNGRADIVIGKSSVVKHDAKANKRKLIDVGQLTGKDGATTQTGLIVVPNADPAKTVADLKDYRVIFGPVESDEKHAAALALLKSNKVTPPKKIETSPGCDDGCQKILEAGATSRGAAVISSYARPLLEGCGKVKKGDLRVIGETKPVPFIVAFVDDKLTVEAQVEIQMSLLDMTEDTELCAAMETLLGFVRGEEPAAEPAKKKQ